MENTGFKMEFESGVGCRRGSVGNMLADYPGNCGWIPALYELVAVHVCNLSILEVGAKRMKSSGVILSYTGSRANLGYKGKKSGTIGKDWGPPSLMDVAVSLASGVSIFFLSFPFYS